MAITNEWLYVHLFSEASPSSGVDKISIHNYCCGDMEYISLLFFVDHCSVLCCVCCETVFVDFKAHMPYESATLLVRGMEVGTSSKKATIRYPQGWRAKNVDINLGRSGDENWTTVRYCYYNVVSLFTGICGLIHIMR